MEADKIIVIFRILKRGEEYDLEIPTDITVEELITGLNEAFHLEMDTADTSTLHLKTENPIALLRGNKLLSEFGLHAGTVINYTE